LKPKDTLQRIETLPYQIDISRLRERRRLAGDEETDKSSPCGDQAIGVTDR